ncbi:MAG: hypothetical protein U5J99_02775 [Parvularculaceae bacterium]|nr:hypothetical protein [Parvularculaceae bacterium]
MNAGGAIGKSGRSLRGFWPTFSFFFGGSLAAGFTGAAFAGALFSAGFGAFDFTGAACLAVALATFLGANFAAVAFGAVFAGGALAFGFWAALAGLAAALAGDFFCVFERAGLVAIVRLQPLNCGGRNDRPASSIANRRRLSAQPREWPGTSRQ